MSTTQCKDTGNNENFSARPKVKVIDYYFSVLSRSWKF